MSIQINFRNHWLASMKVLIILNMHKAIKYFAPFTFIEVYSNVEHDTVKIEIYVH